MCVQESPYRKNCEQQPENNWGEEEAMCKKLNEANSLIIPERANHE